MKTLNEIINFANSNPICFAATIDGDIPRVRGMLMWFANETGFYFYSLSSKKIIIQLKKRPDIELCFYKQGNSFLDSETLRISGHVSFVNNEEMLKKLYNGRKAVIDNSKGSCRDQLTIFRISAGEASCWSAKNILDESRTLIFDIGENYSCFNNGQSNDDQNKTKSYLSFSEREYQYHLDYNAIVYLSSSKKHSIIHTEHRDYETVFLLKDIFQELPESRFMRIHKQYVVNILYVDRIQYYEGGRYIVYLKNEDDTILPVGRKHVSPLKEKISVRIPFIP